MWEFDIKGEAARFARERKAGPYCARPGARGARPPAGSLARRFGAATPGGPTSASSSDRKSTRLNSSHQIISYAVFCLKKKKTLGHSDGELFHGHLKTA